jgi:CheY-like chemotaxis protein/DNA-binding transcriptional ArsR family regulator
MPTAALIIEDDRDNHACVRAVLEGVGVEVKGVYVSVDGRHALEGSKFDVVVVRTDMPELNGMRITEALRRSGENTEAFVIGLAADAKASLPACRQAGMNTVLPRPTPRQDLIAALRTTGVIASAAPWPMSRSLAVFDAFANELRVTLFATLSRDGPASATVLARQIGTSRQKVDFHLETLVEAKLVHRRRTARETLYEARSEGLMGAAQWLIAFADQPGTPPP